MVKNNKWKYWSNCKINTPNRSRKESHLENCIRIDLSLTHRLIVWKQRRLFSNASRSHSTCHFLFCLWDKWRMRTPAPKSFDSWEPWLYHCLWLNWGPNRWKTNTIGLSFGRPIWTWKILKIKGSNRLKMCFLTYQNQKRISRFRKNKKKVKMIRQRRRRLDRLKR